jgi:hypothetical protein
VEVTRGCKWKASMKAEQEGEGNTAGATKVVHAHIRANALEECVARIGNNSWVLWNRD